MYPAELLHLLTDNIMLSVASQVYNNYRLLGDEMRGRYIMINNVLEELEESTKKYNQVELETLLTILQDNCNTEYGKKYHFEEICSMEEYKKSVPITEYEDYEAYIQRMIKEGADNILTSYPVKYYMLSSGTTGNEKHIPMTEQGVINYARYSYQCAYGMVDKYYEERGENKKTLDEKIFMVNEIRYHTLTNGVKSGIVSSAVFEWMREKNIMDFSRYTSPKMILFPEEFMDLMYLKLRFALVCKNVTSIEAVYVHQILSLLKYLQENWEIFVEDIAQGTIHPDIDIPVEKRKELKVYLKPDPQRAEELRIEFEKGFDTPIVPRIWKNIRFVMAISGNAFSRYMDKLRQYIGTIPYHYFIYAASEGIFGPALGVNRPDEYVVAPKIGIYEFLPITEEEEENNLETLQASEVSVGMKYELVYTGFSGFYRYRMGDIVEIKGFYHKAPIVKFCYRKKQTVNVVGEKMDMGSISCVIRDFEEKYDLVGNDFCIYPDEDVIPARYVVLLEIDSDETPNIPEEERWETIDGFFRRVNVDYDDCRNLKEIGMPVVHFLKKGAFERYKEHLHTRGKEIGQHKPVRIIDTEEKKHFFFGEIL